MKRVVVIAVHFRNGDDVTQFVRYAAALSVPAGWTAEIVIVDNSGDAPPMAGVSLFQAPSNLGYLNGVAFGLERWRASNGGHFPDWLVIANADVTLPSGALEELTSTAFDDDVGVVAPAILLAGATPQNPFMERRPSAARMWMYTALFRSALLTRALDLLLLSKRFTARRRRRGESYRPIYAPHGSLIFVRRTFFERGGTLSFPGFMYGEEIHIAEQARLAGTKVAYLPAIRCTHRGSATTSSAAAGERRRWHLDSARLLWKTYFRPPPRS